jgi:enamine deaminase RidA (YjgF/YER057c/UK114 family)
MSQAVVAGNLVFLAGQVALRAPGTSVAEQTRDILARTDELLAEAGTDKTKLVSASIWLSDIAAFSEMNDVWDAWVAPDATPARACVESKLAALQFTVEIAVIALV